MKLAVAVEAEFVAEASVHVAPADSAVVVALAVPAEAAKLGEPVGSGEASEPAEPAESVESAGSAAGPVEPAEPVEPIASAALEEPAGFSAAAACGQDQRVSYVAVLAPRYQESVSCSRAVT